jgi:hypothetical protein
MFYSAENNFVKMEDEKNDSASSVAHFQLFDFGLNEGKGQGCQIVLGTTYQNGKNLTNYHKLHQWDIKYIKWQ